jgi:hypothetical protein
MTNGKMYKVIVPIKGDDEKTTVRWARLGTGFTNKDGSINCHLDVVPVAVFAGKELMLQIREYDEDDLRRRDDARDRRSSNGNGHGASNGHLGTIPF